VAQCTHQAKGTVVLDQTRQCARVVGDGQFAFPIVRESHYQDELTALAGGRSAQGARQFCAALLQPEPDNPYDPSAVSVKVRGHTVGYLGRDAAPILLAALEEAGFASAACEAVIVGGWRRPGEADGHFGVKLNAELPFALIDPDEPPVARARGNSPRVVRIVKRRRGILGWASLLLFAAFNLFMAAWLAVVWPAGFPLAQANAFGGRIAAALGFAMGPYVIAGIWICGVVLLGLLAWLVRGRHAVVEEVTEDWAKVY
jgi:hypothetical protein